MRGVMASLIFDLRDVPRSLRRERAYGTTVVLTLALTLGATTAAFSIVERRAAHSPHSRAKSAVSTLNAHKCRQKSHICRPSTTTLMLDAAEGLVIRSENPGRTVSSVASFAAPASLASTRRRQASIVRSVALSVLYPTKKRGISSARPSRRVRLRRSP
jgi:hypothetical protein